MTVPVSPTRRYPEVMAEEQREDEVVEYVAGFIPVTDAGKARARAKLDAAAARMTPEKWAALREQFGVRPRTAHR